MAGKREWEEFITQFELQWNAPAILEDVMMGLAQVPPEIMANLPPDTQKRISELIGGMPNATQINRTNQNPT